MDQFNSLYSHQSRTAGAHQNAVKSVQAWKKPINIAQHQSSQQAKSAILNDLEKAADGRVGTFDHNIKTLNAYADAGRMITESKANTDQFNFGDVVDIVNPLQHLPVIGMAYRGLTGADLHPMSHIIGGALYGGPVGAVTGTANAIAKVQTGKDMGDHALGFLGLKLNNNPTSAIEAQLNRARDEIESGGSQNDLPRTASAFVNASEIRQATQSYHKISMANGRTAGHMNIIVSDKGVSSNGNSSLNQDSMPNIDLVSLPAKQAITTLSLSAMPATRDI